MRYFITTHGCFRKKETIDLKGVHLLFHAYENECVKYNNAYLQSFCKDSINKLKGKQAPVFTATKKYYEMEFGRQDGGRIVIFNVAQLANVSMILSTAICCCRTQ